MSVAMDRGGGGRNEAEDVSLEVQSLSECGWYCVLGFIVNPSG